MTAKFYAILTNQGAAILANAAALGTKINLTQMAVGDANGALPTPDPAQTKLVNQKRIAPINTLSIDPNNDSQIIAEQVIPENEGGFWIREIGLFDETGVLVAVANCPETYKPQLQEGSGRTQVIRMMLIVSSTSAVTLKVDPSVVLATREYVDNKAIEVKAYADDLMKKHVAAENPHAQYLQSKNNLSEVADKAKARGSLGLGSAALKNTGTSGDTVPLANGANTWSAKQTFSGGAEGALAGNASTATKLQTTRKIGGVAFDGSADINLPGVNAAGNQATSGNAATATKLQAAHKIGGVAFDGSADINLPGVNAAGNQATSGNAATATKLQSARKIGGVAFDGGADITLPGVNAAGNQATSGNAGSATKLQTARKIGGAAFDGTADISTDTLRQNLGLGEGSALPTGVPVPWPTATPPAGWLMCNGAAFDKAKYPKLALAYPSGKLPDLRGEFIRGWDNGRGVDAARGLLSWQKATLIGGRDDNDSAIDISYMSNGSTIDYGGDIPSPDNYDSNSLWYASIGAVDNASRNKLGLMESFFTTTRPRNIAFNYIVRAA